jgi:hypothetical protein
MTAAQEVGTDSREPRALLVGDGAIARVRRRYGGFVRIGGSVGPGEIAIVLADGMNRARIYVDPRCGANAHGIEAGPR